MAEIYVIITASDDFECEVELAAPLCGRPLLQWVLDACAGITGRTRGFLASNSQEAISSINLHGLFAPLAMKHARERMPPPVVLPPGTPRGLFQSFDLPSETIIVLVSGRAPLIQAEDLNGAVQKITSHEARIVASMNPCRTHPVRLLIQPHIGAPMVQYPLDHLWRNRDAKVIDARTGKVLLHRQDYPAILEANRNFLVFRWEDRHSIQQMVNCGLAGAQITPPERSTVVLSLIDLIETEVFLEGREGRDNPCRGVPVSDCRFPGGHASKPRDYALGSELPAHPVESRRL